MNRLSIPFRSATQNRTSKRADPFAVNVAYVVDIRLTLIRDMCDTGLDLFYRGKDSDALRPVPLPMNGNSRGIRKPVTNNMAKRSPIEDYIDAFLELWNRELGPDDWFRWQIIRPRIAVPLLGVIFSTQAPAENESNHEIRSLDWTDVLRRLGLAARHPFGANSIFIDSMTRIVRENDITIIKKNQRRLWTRSAAM